MAGQFLTFLDKWIDTFPEYRDDDVSLSPLSIYSGILRPQLYLAGESYAGQHIPYIAAEILKHNKEHGDVFTSDHWS